MNRYVLDTNCLIQILSPRSRYRNIWNDFLQGRYELCVSDDILREYAEIIEGLINAETAEIMVNLLLNSSNIIWTPPYYHFGLITADPDDNKFVDCAIAAGAKYIVSEDSHFKFLQQCDFPKVEVIDLDHFSLLLGHN